MGWTLLSSCLVVFSVGCSARRLPVSPAPSGPVIAFNGACDASGAVALGGWKFVVADDEDNVLRIYDGRMGGLPLGTVDVSSWLGLGGEKRAPELDLEAATSFQSRALWLASHGRRSSGKIAEPRLQLFATTLAEEASNLHLHGHPYTRLLEDLLSAPQLSPFELEAAALKAPKAPGGLNLEAMTATLDGSHVLVGFRNPIPHGMALVIPILNPLGLFEGQRAQLGTPKTLDLGGRGLRSLSTWNSRYLIVAGSYDSDGPSELYEWDGESAPKRISGVSLGDLNAEAFVTPEAEAEILILSDDGSRALHGVECKRLKDLRAKSFRGMRVRPKTL
jgi:hypothetical protein